MAGWSTDSGGQPAFFYDLASPDAYLAAERISHVLGVVPEFVPVRIGSVGAFRCAEEETIYRSDVERRAAAYGLMPLRWPAVFPADTDWALLVATYAKQAGRVVAYSMAAFRQAFAAGRDLGERDSVLIAAAAAEMHPAAVAKGAELKGTRARLEAATEAARAAGVRDVPALLVGDRVFHGDRELEAAARALQAAA
jgi:2-hydroxychromene-2-carboxylate isomerase